jgi:hypothetical protein
VTKVASIEGVPRRVTSVFWSATMNAVMTTSPNSAEPVHSSVSVSGADKIWW